MDILKLRINNLFQKYSVELDLRKKMNILYGANGIGKTTVLRFYQALVNNDFIEILRWDFDSIEVLAYEHGREEGERSFYIERKDLLPDIDTLKYFYAKYSEKIYPFWDNAYDRDRAEKNAEELFTHLMKEKLYYKFLCNCLFDISNSMEINTILKIYDYNNKIYINTIPNLMKELEKQCGRRDCARYLAFTKFSKDFVGHENRYMEICIYDGCYSKTKNTYYLDLVKSFEFECPEKAVTVVKSNTLLWLENANDSLGQGDGFSMHMNAFEMAEYLSGPKNLIKASEYLEHLAGEYYWLFLSRVYDNINDFTTDIYKNSGETYSFAECSIQKFIKERKININAVISAYYYKPGFLKEINRKVADICKRVIAGEIRWEIGSDDYEWIEKEDLQKYHMELRDEFESDEFLAEYFRDEENIYFIENYIRPVICENFRVSVEKCSTSTDNMWDDEKTSTAFLCYITYKEILPSLLEKNNINEKILKLEERLNNCFYDKEIEILPSGIFVKIKREADNSKIVPIRESKNDCIGLNELSSGEKKIILLFVIAAFSNRVSVILDEPELSLSVLWQEHLLPDLIEEGCFKNLIVATHSPYMAMDERVQDCIVFLPAEDNLDE